MINGYPTIADAAAELGVSPKTIREWIEKKIIDPPPTAEGGARTFLIFPPEYMKKLNAQLKAYRESKKREKKNRSQSKPAAL